MYGAFALAAIIPATFWIKTGWYHYELLSVPDSVWSPARNGSWERQLATTLYDWRIFDPNSHRLRPLSDLVEVIDAMVRPLRLFGTHPSLSLCAVLLAVTTAVAFYRAVRESGQGRLESACYTLFFVTTIGYLSCYVPYIRPAKKLALLFCSLTLFFCSRYRASRRGLPFLWLVVFLAFFSDEAGFVFWPVACGLLVPIMLAERRWKSLTTLAGLPLVYLVAVKLVVPSLYALVGVPRRMEVGVMGNLLGALAVPKFYLVACADFSTSLLATFGIVGAPGWLGGLALAAVAGMAGVLVGRRQWWQLAALAVPMIASFGLTLFDGYNTPLSSNAFGALTYYYHSPIALLVVFALSQFRVPDQVLAPIVLVVVALNMFAFNNLNRVAVIMHTYPLDARALPRRVEAPESLAAEFQRRVKLLNPRERGWFETTFAYYQAHPMGGSNYVRRFKRMYFPNVIDVRSPSPPGGLDFEVTFPSNRLGQSEPLITTGQAGAGDFVYVVYLDAHHVQFGFDHWGVGGFLSAPILVDYRVAHHLRISLGSLSLGNSGWQRPGHSSDKIEALRNRLSIRIDEKLVLDAVADFYPTQPLSVTVGQNRIGGSTTGPKFTGHLLPLESRVELPHP